MHVVKTKHIKMRRNIDELFVSPEHSEKCSYEVLTHGHQNVECKCYAVNKCHHLMYELIKNMGQPN